MHAGLAAPDLPAIQRRIKEVAQVLANFASQRDPARPRSDYIDQVAFPFEPFLSIPFIANFFGHAYVQNSKSFSRDTRRPVPPAGRLFSPCDAGPKKFAIVYSSTTCSRLAFRLEQLIPCSHHISSTWIQVDMRAVSVEAGCLCKRQL